jgi:putative membrane protein
MMGNWGNMMGSWGNSGYGWMGMIMPLIFGIGFILLVIYLFRRNSIQVYPDRFGKQDAGLDILCERYARGEIDSVEFQSKKHDLEGK